VVAILSPKILRSSALGALKKDRAACWSLGGPVLVSRCFSGAGVNQGRIEKGRRF
jgi:hypothetical protein